MATEQHQENTEKVADKGGGGRGTDGIKEGQSTRQKESTPIFSPPSASSSPSHEFSFTISLHPSSTVLADKTKSTPSFAIDLSPADDIFFHGHLLPLHLLSHFPISPRSSTNSADGYNPPIRDLSEDGKSNNSINSKSSNNDINGHNTVNKSNSNDNNNNKSHGGTSVPKVRSKPKSFSLFGLAKWRKGCEVGEKEDKDEEKKRKLRFEVSHMLKRLTRFQVI
uniref:Uncharacterized protein n=1 Tax=Nelumbo nucifera TaxID=4432 RepID=A0A822XNG4_NELNU|nr:TPA_asm: hypothetical protein HUJ06_023045 [Nelumbo nucifera]